MLTDGQLTCILYYVVKVTYEVIVMEDLLVEPLALSVVMALGGA